MKVAYDSFYTNELQIFLEYSLNNFKDKVFVDVCSVFGYRLIVSSQQQQLFESFIAWSHSSIDDDTETLRQGARNLCPTFLVAEQLRYMIWFVSFGSNGKIKKCSGT